MKETFVWNGQMPWDGIGKPISNNMTTEEMLKAADLDWKVLRQTPHFYFRGQKRPALRDVLYRDTDGQVLTEVPPGWHELQNHDAFEFTQEWVDAGKMKLLSAGSLKGGKLVWVLAEVGEEFTIFKHDTHRNNLLFTIPHEYGKSIDIRQTPLRISCNNMIALALSRKGHLTIRWDHRRQFDASTVKATMGLANRQFFEFRDIALHLGEKRYTDESLNEFLTQLYPVTKVDENSPNSKFLSQPATVVKYHLERQPGFEHQPGTWWSVFNAVTFSISHVLGRERETAVYSAWYGKQRNKAIESMNIALEFADKS